MLFLKLLLLLRCVIVKMGVIVKITAFVKMCVIVKMGVILKITVIVKMCYC